MNNPIKVLLAAGGTGGHLFPAESLANVLAARGIAVELVSDDRAAIYAGTFPAKMHQITSGTVTGSGLLGKIKGGLKLMLGVRQALRLMTQVRPSVVVGFGGYPTVPPVYAATIRLIPTILHEQNAVMGRANRFLAPKVSQIATGFPLADRTYADKLTVVGNPVRPPVLEAARVPYPALDAGGPIHLLVFGGSQGARVMSDNVPPAIEKLSAAQRARLVITQQARAEDVARVQEIYTGLGVKAEVAPFFKDLPARIAAAHLVIARSGASTVAELSVIGRPSILVPLPGSLDQDQAANAKVLADAGAALVQPQTWFTPDWLSGELATLIENPAQLADLAAKARSVAMPDAAERLADLVIAIATR